MLDFHSVPNFLDARCRNNKVAVCRAPWLKWQLPFQRPCRVRKAALLWQTSDKMNLEEFFSSGSNVIDLRAQDRWQAIEELLDNLVTSQKILPEHRASIAASVRKRESTMSTGIGYGVGLPHASTEFVTEPIGLLGRSREGIQFDALDGKPVHLVLLFLVPVGQIPKHLNTLANIAKLLRQQEFRDELLRRFL